MDDSFLDCQSEGRNGAIGTSMTARLLKPAAAITCLSALNIGILTLTQAFVASRFGAGGEMDAYWVARTVPNIVIAILFGSVASVIVPVLADYTSHEGQVWQIASILTNVVAALLVIAAVASIVVAPEVMRVIAPGLSESNARLATKLFLVISPSIVFAGLAAVLSAVHLSRHSYTRPVLAQVINGLVVLLTIIILTPLLGIRALALGVWLGAFAHFVFLVPIIAMKGRYSFIFRFRHPGVMKIIKLLIPLQVGLALYWVTNIIERSLASALPEGSISYLAYASKLLSILVTLSVTGVSTVTFPLSSEYASAKDFERLLDVFSLGVRMSMLVATPVMVSVAILRVPLTQLFFERGVFGREATEATAQVLLFYLGFFYVNVLGAVVVNTFYSMKDTLTPILVNMPCLVLYYGLATVLREALSFYGLGLAMSIYFVFTLVCYLLILKRRLKHIRGHQLLRAFVKIWLASLISGGAIWIVAGVLHNVFNLAGAGHLVLYIAISLGAGLAVFVPCCFVLRLEEVIRILTSFRLRFQGILGMPDLDQPCHLRKGSS